MNETLKIFQIAVDDYASWYSESPFLDSGWLIMDLNSGSDKAVTELIQENCNAKLIFEELRHLMLNKEVCERQISDSEFALDILGLNSAKSPSNKAAAEILKL